MPWPLPCVAGRGQWLRHRETRGSRPSAKRRSSRRVSLCKIAHLASACTGQPVKLAAPDANHDKLETIARAEVAFSTPDRTNSRPTPKPCSGRSTTCVNRPPRSLAAATRSRASATSPAASFCRATRVDGLLDPGTPFLEIGQLAAHGMYDGAGAGGRHDRRHRSRPRAGGDDRRQRRDGEGRHLLSDDGEEAPAGAGDRAAEPAAVHLPRRQRRRLPAAARRRLPRTASTSAASSSTRPT